MSNKRTFSITFDVQPHETDSLVAPPPSPLISRPVPPDPPGRSSVAPGRWRIVGDSARWVPLTSRFARVPDAPVDPPAECAYHCAFCSQGFETLYCLRWHQKVSSCRSSTAQQGGRPLGFAWPIGNAEVATRQVGAPGSKLELMEQFLSRHYEGDVGVLRDTAYFLCAAGFWLDGASRLRDKRKCLSRVELAVRSLSDTVSVPWFSSIRSK